MSDHRFAINADFDEVICYVRGPGVRGGCSEPGTLTCVPKGVIHHGPSENVPEGYQAWLMETRATLRWTSEAIAASALMERRLPTAPEREQTMRVATLRVAQVEVFAERARVLHVENVQRWTAQQGRPVAQPCDRMTGASSCHCGAQAMCAASASLARNGRNGDVVTRERPPFEGALTSDELGALPMVQMQATKRF